jgi:hypothetical protein
MLYKRVSATAVSQTFESDLSTSPCSLFIFDTQLPPTKLQRKNATPFWLLKNPLLQELTDKLIDVRTEFFDIDGDIKASYAGPGGLSEQDIQCLKTLPDRYYNSSIENVKETATRLKSILNCTTSRYRLAAMKGLLFEYAAHDYIHDQHVDLYIDQQRPISVSYIGYDRSKINDYIDPHSGDPVPLFRRHTKSFSDSRLEFDAPAKKSIGHGRKRKSQPCLPYVYETKCYGSREVYASPGHVNQILKYQAAIDQNLLSGATLEIRGRIAPNLIGWLIELAPDVQVILNIELPSGASFRLDLHKGANSIPVKNRERYSAEDQEIIKTIRTVQRLGPDVLTAVIHEAGDTLGTMVHENRFGADKKPDALLNSTDYYKQKISLRNSLLWEAFASAAQSPE